MRIAQLSDFHYTQATWNPLRLFSKRLLGNLNWFFKRNSSFSTSTLKELPKLFEELEVDLILLGGDFTTTAMPEEYLLAQKFVKKLKKPWLAIPGNHDHYTYWSFKRKRFYKYLANKPRQISCSAEFFTLKEQGIEAHKISNNSWVIALDTAKATNPYSSRGLFSEKLEGYMIEVLGLIPLDHSIIVLNHYPFFQNDLPRRTLKRGEALMALLKKDKRIKLYLHGHTHRQTIANLQANDLPIVLDSGSCTQIKQASWNLIDLENGKCTISPYRWDGKWKKEAPEEMLWTRE